MKLGSLFLTLGATVVLSPAAFADYTCELPSAQLKLQTFELSEAGSNADEYFFGEKKVAVIMSKGGEVSLFTGIKKQNPTRIGDSFRFQLNGEGGSEATLVISHWQTYRNCDRAGTCDWYEHIGGSLHLNGEKYERLTCQVASF